MRFDNNSRILVVAAHPDDEVLGMGGTIARATSYGSQVFVLFLGEGFLRDFQLVITITLVLESKQSSE